MAEEESGQDLSWFFDGLVYGAGSANYKVDSLEAQRALLSHEGELALPVEILVTFSDGSTQLVTWAGDSDNRVLDYPYQTIRSAQIDPDHKLVIDLVWSDNGCSLQADSNAWLALVVHMLYSLQNGLLVLGGF